MQKEEKYWVWLSQMKGLSIPDVEGLKKQYGSLEEVWNEKNANHFLECVRKTIAEQLGKQVYKEQTEHIVKLMENKKVKLVHYQKPSYPYMLKQIYNAPAVFFLKGTEDILNTKAIAIIGSRNASDYGKRIAKEMAEGLAKQQYTIISGLAKGIDTKAHEGALLANGSTVAVLAGGVDYIYPKENENLYEKILEKGGAIISENGITCQPEKQDFPKRNRLISGMAKGVLVVEAAEKSGTGITVDFALEQGRDVFAVPGNITSLQSKGSNRLIKEGAKCVLEVEDILEECK